MTEDLLYDEEISSNRTEALFLALTGVFGFLFVWRMTAVRPDVLAAVCLCVSAVFGFYSANYRTLHIRLTPEALTLTFGIFTWRVPLDNVETCCPDEIPRLLKYGGAGIHFMMVRRRYRASFNFLEYPRVVIAFRQKAGPVQDISFSTRRPDEILRLLQAAIANRHARLSEG